MLRFLILLAPLSLSACMGSSGSGSQVDPNLASQTYSDLDTQAELDTSDLPSTGSADYDGYITIIDFSSSSDAIGALSAKVDFKNMKYTMSADSWIEFGALDDTVIKGSMKGSGSIVTSATGGTAEIDGTFAGQVDGKDIDLDLIGTFTGSGSGTPTGIRGAADGGTHSAQFGLTN